MTVKFQQASAALFLLGNRFLKQHKQSLAGKQDLLFVATHYQKIIGAVKLERYPDFFWLRSLFIEPAYRQQRIGSQLIHTVLSELESKQIYCFPLNHLNHFYHSLGWQTIEENQLPAELAAKYASYRQSGKKFLIMANKKPSETGF